MALELFSVPSGEYAQLKSKLFKGRDHIFKISVNGLKLIKKVSLQEGILLWLLGWGESDLTV